VGWGRWGEERERERREKEGGGGGTGPADLGGGADFLASDGHLAFRVLVAQVVNPDLVVPGQ
jgi:hypothetical protein